MSCEFNAFLTCRFVCLFNGTECHQTDQDPAPYSDAPCQPNIMVFATSRFQRESADASQVLVVY